MDDAQIEVLVEANDAVGVHVPLSILLLLARVDQAKKDLKMVSDVVMKEFPWIKHEQFKDGLWCAKMAELDAVVYGLAGKYIERYEQWVAIGEAFEDVLGGRAGGD